MFKGLVLTLSMTGSMLYGMNDAYSNVRAAALNIAHVYSVAGHMTAGDVASEQALMASVAPLQGMADFAQNHEQLIVIQ